VKRYRLGTSNETGLNQAVNVPKVPTIQFPALVIQDVHEVLLQDTVRAGMSLMNM
jgi:hypothetical protein